MDISIEPADFVELEKSMTLPEGYVIGSIASYHNGQGLHGRALGYSVAVQLVNVAFGSTARGCADDRVEALRRAIEIVHARGF